MRKVLVMSYDVSNLRHFFEARSIAVIGASEKPGTIGRAIMTNLLERFKGKIYPVNIKYDQVFGLKCFKSVLEIPDEVDLAVIAVPAKVVPKVADDCGKKGVKTLLVISAGFKEVGPEGAELERRLVEVVRKYGMRMIGPNCLGIYDAHTGLDTIFNPSEKQLKPKPGVIAFISQSGALGAAILDWMGLAGIGMSKFISYGNAADVKEYELIEYLAEDPKTKVITAYIEGVEDGRKLMSAVSKAVRLGKPVVVLKAGKTERGAKAASSHTGALAGAYKIYEAGLKQAGAIIVDDLYELFIALKALSLSKPPKGKGVAIVTNGGGAGVLATDSIELLGLEVANLSRETIDELRKVLPPAASPYNPVDVLGDAPASRYEEALRIVSKDPNVHSILVIALLQAPALDGDELVNTVREFSKSVDKPIVMSFPGGAYAEKYMKIMEEAGIPSFKTVMEAVKAIKYLYEFSVRRAKALTKR